MSLPAESLSSAELFDIMPCGVVVTDAKGLILKVNRTLCAWLEMEAGDLVLKKTLQELFTMGGRIFHQTHWQPALQMQGSLAEVKFDLRRRDGRVLPMMLNAVRRREGDECVDVVTLTVAEERNKYERELVAARKRADELVEKERASRVVRELAQARLQQAMRVAAIYLWDVDSPSGRRQYEPEVARLLGSAPRAVDEGEFLGAIVPEDAAAEATAFAQALAHPDAPHSWSYRLQGHDGADRVIISACQALLDADGAPIRFVGVLTDVTEATRLREQAEDRALFAEQMIGIVSHDLRNPLSAILVGTQLLGRGDGVAPARRDKLVKSVMSSARSAQRLVDDLLDFTAARVGRGLSISRRRADIHLTVGHAVDKLRLAYPGRELRHVQRGSGPGDHDQDRVAQMLGNLVSNAMTYGDTSRPVCVTSEVASGWATISVHNVGAPIAASTMETMFEPMVRGNVDEMSSRSVGLGLYIVQQIATAHAGVVTVESTALAGTTFSVRFAC